MHENQASAHKNRALMIRIHSQTQLTLDGFEAPFERSMDKNNRWVKLSACIPWDELSNAYYQCFNANTGRPAKEGRLVVGAVIIKHRLKLSDAETVAQIQENPYLQYFCGLKGFSIQAPFAPSLLVEIRKRMGFDVFEQLHQAIIDQLERRTLPTDKTTGSDTTSATRQEQTSLVDTPTETSTDHTALTSDAVADEKPSALTHQGRLLLDATVAEQAIRFPTDLSLLNESREISEGLIDELYALSSLTRKPRTYRKNARKAYLAIVKLRRPGYKKIRKGIKEQLQYLQRNLTTVEALLNGLPNRAIPLSPKRLKQYWVIQHVFSQQADMYRHKTHRCDDRIVSIHQPHVRPIIRGKLNKSVEFGAKMSVSLTAQGLAKVDHIRWDAFNESNDLEAQVEAYHRRYGFYPEAVVADPVYGTKKNRAYLKDKGIRYAGKALGRPKKVTEQNREQLKRDKHQRQADYRQRIPIEGKFGQGKRAYGLNLIQAKTARTSEAWINSIFLVMNLLVLLRHFFVPAIIQRCTNKFFEFLSKIITMNMTSPSKLITNGYANRWLLSF